MTTQGDTKTLSAEQAQEILRLANIIYFRQGVYQTTYWQGIETAKCPMDMWIYQELIHSLDINLLIETGTYKGGSALYFANILEQKNSGQVISIDISLQPDLPQHPRISYMEGSSIDDNVLTEVSEKVRCADNVLVILDSDHNEDYKLREMRAYAPFVTPDSYLIAEDTCFDYFPSWPEFGAGPAAAVDQFLKENSNFQMDRRQERHMMTFAPAGFLRRAKPES